MIALGIDTLGSLVLAVFALHAAWHLLSHGRSAAVWLGMTAGIRLGLSFKVAATLLNLSTQPDLAHLAKVAVVISLRLLIRSRTVDTAQRLAAGA